MLTYLAMLSSAGWLVMSVVDSVPMLAKPLQLIGLVTILHWCLNNQELLRPHLQKAWAATGEFTPPPSSST